MRRVTLETVQQVLDGNTKDVQDKHVKQIYDSIIGIQGQRVPNRCAASGRIVQSGAIQLKLDSDGHYILVNPLKQLPDGRLNRLKSAVTKATSISVKKPVSKGDE